MDRQTFLNYLKDRDFTTLFTESGWGAPISNAPISVVVRPGTAPYRLTEVAQKQFRIYACEVDAFPPASIRRTLDAKIRKFSHAYFVIFTQKGEPFHQQWFVPVDAVDKRRIVVAEYADDTHAAPLYDKLNGITFGTDETPSVLDVIARVNAQFLQNANRVTDSFYEGFQKQHKAFVKDIVGIPDDKDRDWYASVMLNRLMFCYFIQKKGFFMDKNANPDVNYLQNKLKLSQDKGNDQFYGKFYKGFLRGLFEQGLNMTAERRPKSFIAKYGLIPYLNGGMFEQHKLENQYTEIDVPDKVFVSLFNFFDEWNWHLDDRLERDGRDINPDLLGYIFEQYINDRAQMGAYYTKEDITEYIGRNCLLPYLFGAVEKMDPKPFKKDGFVWRTLKNSGDTYIYDAVKKGVDIPLPDYIERGVSTVGRDLRARRARWNEPATPEYALPTEIWRETVARRLRCADVRAKIAAGEITDIHDFITYNLKIRNFAEDLIRTTDDHLFVKHFYDAVRSVTVLDPTCGSGAFLFAALNILEPLYEACLDRMEESAFARYFKDELAEIAAHYRSNRQYFIYKNIILRNLYGVDIMHEATEIARLRLFLKMVAVVEADPSQPNLGLDPLPDVDFNIRCGNTLVGYASRTHLEKSLQNSPNALFAQDELEKISHKAADIADLCATFRNHQLQRDYAFSQEKKELKRLIADLSDQLDESLAKSDYGIDASSVRGRKAFAEWKTKTQPFHWYSEFYNIIVYRGGFDVIIGNPPYLEQNQIEYSVFNYRSIDTNAVHAWCMERSEQLLNGRSSYGMIVPLSLPSTQRMRVVQEMLEHNCSCWYSNYSWRPAKLFDTVNRALTIFLVSQGAKSKVRTMATNYCKWTRFDRDGLFERIVYQDVPRNRPYWWVPKFGSCIELSVLNKIFQSGNVYLRQYFTDSGSRVYYRVGGGLYWKVFTDFAPRFLLNGVEGHSSRETWMTVGTSDVSKSFVHCHPIRQCA